MDVEKAMQFLLEQQAAISSRMDELQNIVGELAVNTVAIGKAQARYDQQQARMQELQVGHEERIQRLEESPVRVNEALETLTKRMDRIIERGFPTDGGQPS